MRVTTSTSPPDVDDRAAPPPHVARLVDVAGASFGYGRRAVVGDVWCGVGRSRCLGVYGPNGSGKTTLLRGVTGLLPPIGGRVAIAAGTRFGYLPQQRAGEAHWPMTALDAASLDVSARARCGFVGRADRDRVLGRMAEMGVADLARRPFFQLSGGQQQRVRLAGALAAGPDVLLLDEPTDGIDARARDQLLDRLRQAAADGLALVVVSHDLSDLTALADEALLLEAPEEPGQPSRATVVHPDELLARAVRRGGRGGGAA